MINITFKIFLNNIENPFEFNLKDNNTFSFNYGFGREQWGSHSLRFKIKLYTMDKNNIKIIKDFLENLCPYVNGYENIKKIIIECFDTETNEKEIFSFEKNEFSNLNITQTMDSLHETTFAVAFNINPLIKENNIK